MKKRHVYAGVIGIAVLLLTLIAIQLVWIKDAAKAAKVERELHVQSALRQTEHAIIESNTCFHFFTKAYLSPGEGMYITRQHWKDDAYTGKPDTVNMYYDYSEFHKSSSGGPIPYSFSEMHTESRPMYAEISIRFHYFLSDGIDSFNKEKASLENISQYNFRTLNYNQRPIDKIMYMDEVDSLLVNNLKDENIDGLQSFSFINAKTGKVEYEQRNANSNAAIETYKAQIFNADKFMQPYILQVSIAKPNAIYQSGIWLLISVSVVVLLVLLFGYFVRLYNRQVQLSEMRTDFIQNLTHEFNTPMANISLALETLNENPAEQNARTNKMLKIIAVESSRLEENISRALQVVTIENDKFMLHKERTDLAALIDTIISSYQLQCEQLGGTITYEHIDEAIVYADETHLLNCVCNLLDNAIKYRKGQPNIYIDLTEKDEHIILRISDNGIGMNATTQKNIFEKFYRAHQGNVHNTKGFGLGLNYVRSIVNMHNGTIMVSSNPGHGSKFTITLPKA